MASSSSSTPSTVSNKRDRDSCSAKMSFFKQTNNAGGSTTSTTTNPPNELIEKLASVLPKDVKFSVHHLSTPPTRTDALYAAPPGEKPDKTYCEKHFLSLSIDAPIITGAIKRSSPGADEAKSTETTTTKQVIAFAIEVFIFTTAFQTVLFVSKADSTGYLHLLKLPRGGPSPISAVSSTFVSYLIQHRRRKHIVSVVNLFGRAQNQYLFPGSGENDGIGPGREKHILSDRGLIKWWCRVLNPLLQDQRKDDRVVATKGYLLVPGLEERDMRAFLPQTVTSASDWEIGHPMERISRYTREFDWVPPRCLIPRYPDDPKSRYRDELDEESAKWKQDMGTWKSIRTLNQFWDAMAFRQECSSGRLTGFIWLVFDPKESETEEQATQATTASFSTSFATAPLMTPTGSFDPSTAFPPSTPPKRRADAPARTPQASPLKASFTAGQVPESQSGTAKETSKREKDKKKKLKGRITPRVPKVKKHQRNYLFKRPNTTAYYHWPVEGRGDLMVDEHDYKRVVELLLQLDFETLDKACSATKRWISEAGMGAKWGHEVVGKRILTVTNATAGRGSAAPVNNLTGLVRKKKPAAVENGAADAKVNGLEDPFTNKGTAGDVVNPLVLELPRVNVLGAGLIRKKPKTSAS
ncbi:histone acetylation protein-domain-containing protein [Pseudoneurospora amorphoporcata]|uniref:histone acetyltransferase n=1 Tax=Pseudoneurospora amorphoporcata TaxID=241081 RepID=A0AAN6SID6_9PEZI|nr:histone acetylation protein-domain-containing protein [Pseudoneurospora amorphoporcata]